MIFRFKEQIILLHLWSCEATRLDGDLRHPHLTTIPLNLVDGSYQFFNISARYGALPPVALGHNELCMGRRHKEGQVGLRYVQYRSSQ